MTDVGERKRVMCRGCGRRSAIALDRYVRGRPSSKVGNDVRDSLGPAMVSKAPVALEKHRVAAGGQRDAKMEAGQRKQSTAGQVQDDKQCRRGLAAVRVDGAPARRGTASLHCFRAKDGEDLFGPTDVMSGPFHRRTGRRDALGSNGGRGGIDSGEMGTY
ncbi:hypothetical protein OH77DRAFT_1431434 [Trametes cingulata]|nr:hypothetical protein OH77DRAFT_1431434 [Trametes cingulata]